MKAFTAEWIFTVLAHKYFNFGIEIFDQPLWLKGAYSTNMLEVVTPARKLVTNNNREFVHFLS
jgi:hypothetical protein